ncbi:glycosyltransferase family 2 protein [Roseivirga sp. E12]|uniref:glycosyltransferase family 2 protein n=1 Tax=Roseivirga sp. E12 TaxID=2819237 RepID=UPI001ABCBA13|nr:glycosyltransferase family 2 protein [Roseivirga sp. E12]MBO3698538.1 glycosyltransferase family 2 protein [Roseivirga sp. E12]
MSQSVKISGVIITFNEEENIKRCLTSLEGVCDELLVVDSFSTDRTREIAKGLGARVIENPWKGFLDQKNFAQNAAQYDYVLQLDADEELSESLKAQIATVKNSWSYDGYFFNRFTNYCGKWIKHSGWYPDSKLRLYNRKKGNWRGLDPHPEVIMKAGSSTVAIKADINHYSYTSYEDHINRSAKYAKEAALAMKAMGKNPSIIKLIASPFYRFINDYFFRGGFRDGFEGLIICKTASYYTFLKYMYLRLIHKGKSVE